MMKYIAAIALSICLTGIARADDSTTQVHGGFEHSSIGGNGIVFGLTFDGFHEDGKIDEVMKLFQMKSKMTLRPSGGVFLPSYEVEIVPYQTEYESSERKVFTVGSARLLRDYDLGEKGSAHLYVLYAKAESENPTAESAFFYKVATHGFGAALANFEDVSGRDITQFGAEIFSFNLNFGYDWRISEKTNLRLTFFDGQADVSVMIPMHFNAATEAALFFSKKRWKAFLRAELKSNVTPNPSDEDPFINRSKYLITTGLERRF